MSTLYLDRRGLELRAEGRHLCLYETGERRSTVPLHLLRRIVIRGSTTLSTDVLGLLAEANVGLLVLSGRQGRRVATLLGQPHGDTARRVAQYRWYTDPDQRLRWARVVVQLKLRSQRRMLLRAAALRGDLKPTLEVGAQRITKQLNGLRNEPREQNAQMRLARLNGVEGAAAAAYFAAYTQLFPPSAEFRERNRRPPKDPVNACLSLGYTLLHFAAVQACHHAGLDPYLGCYHELAYGRESLACDLVEPLRVRIDTWVWRMFAERDLRGEHFSRDGEACLLGKTGREHFFAAYETIAPELRRALHRYAGGVARQLSTAGAP